MMLYYINNFDCGALQPGQSVTDQQALTTVGPCLVYTVMSSVLIMAKGLITIYADNTKIQDNRDNTFKDIDINLFDT